MLEAPDPVLEGNKRKSIPISLRSAGQKVITELNGGEADSDGICVEAFSGSEFGIEVIQRIAEKY